MNSMPERFTPRRTTCAPLASTSLLPETCSAGALPSPVPVLAEAEGEGDADAEAEGDADTDTDGDGDGDGEGEADADAEADGEGLAAPLQAAPLTVNEVGAALVPL